MSVTQLTHPTLHLVAPGRTRWNDLLRRVLGLPRPSRGALLAVLPCLAALCATLAAWDVARPLGLAVAAVVFLLLETRFTPDESDRR